MSKINIIDGMTHSELAIVQKAIALIEASNEARCSLDELEEHYITSMNRKARNPRATTNRLMTQACLKYAASDESVVLVRSMGIGRGVKAFFRIEDRAAVEGSSRLRHEATGPIPSYRPLSGRFR